LRTRPGGRGNPQSNEIFIGVLSMEQVNEQLYSTYLAAREEAQ